MCGLGNESKRTSVKMGNDPLQAKTGLGQAEPTQKPMFTIYKYIMCLLYILFAHNTPSFVNIEI